MENRNNEFLSSFSPFNHEFSLGNWLKDTFLDCLSFYSYSRNIKSYIKNLDNITFEAFSDPFSVVIISNTSIKNHVATLILHIYLYDKLIIKTIHWAINITITETKLFAICCSINQAIGISNVKCIVIITNFIYATRKIFDLSMHPYQIYYTAIFQELRVFFMKNVNNCIKFWDCPSKLKWPLHSLVDNNTRSFNSTPNYLCKLSWNFCKKCDCNSIIV